jgi:hypothetical protein
LIQHRTKQETYNVALLIIQNGGHRALTSTGIWDAGSFEFAEQFTHRQSSDSIDVTTLTPHQYVYPDEKSLGASSILSLLPNSPNVDVAIGTTTQVPPTPDSLKENPKFLEILQSVLKEHAHADPGVQSQAQAFASTSGSSLGSGGVFFPNQKRNRRLSGGAAGGDGAGCASSQGGAGGGGRGGWVHLSDSRAPPDYGRIAWPEDIFGSLEVDSAGNFVGEFGGYQPSGTYRIITRDGM